MISCLKCDGVVKKGATKYCSVTCYRSTLNKESPGAQALIRSGVGNKHNLGRKHTKEAREKRSASLKEAYKEGRMKKGMLGKIPWNKGLKGASVPWNKGAKTPLDVREKQSLAKKGKKGQKHTEQARRNMSVAQKMRKEQGPFWKGGITKENLAIRNSFEYKLWREAVFERDDYTCVFCKKRGYKLNADHIKPFSLFPELRFAIDNGRTLCVPCHKTTDTYGYKAKSFNLTIV